MTVQELMRKLEFAPKNMEIATVVNGSVAPISDISYVTRDYKGFKQHHIVLDWRNKNW